MDEIHFQIKDELKYYNVLFNIIFSTLPKSN
jgi:hypothetical protein